MILKITTDQEFEYELSVSCLKYSRITKTWVFYSKSITKRRAMALPNEIAESLLKSNLTTRHDKGDYVLFQVNVNPFYAHQAIAFDPKKHL